MTVVSQGQDFVSNENDIALAKTWLGPFDLASGQFDALERAGAVLLVAEKAVETAILNDGCAPMIGELVVGNSVKVGGDEFVSALRNPAGAAADSVSCRAINDVSRDDERGCGGSTEPKRKAPKKRASKPLDSFFGFSSRAARAGLSVRALKAENATEMAMVMANCW